MGLLSGVAVLLAVAGTVLLVLMFTGTLGQ
jgi:hypothetical protein